MNATAYSLSLDTRVYSLETAQRAALKFSDFASYDFAQVGEHEILVSVTFKTGLDVDVRDFEFRYRTELLDQHLRQQISAETKNERDLILAHAFSNTKLLG